MAYRGYKYPYKSPLPYNYSTCGTPFPNGVTVTRYPPRVCIRVRLARARTKGSSPGKWQIQREQLMAPCQSLLLYVHLVLGVQSERRRKGAMISPHLKINSGGVNLRDTAMAQA